MSFPTVIAFPGAWNIHLWAQLVLEETARKAIAAGFAMFADAEGGQRFWDPLISTSFPPVLPVLLLFLAAQRLIIEAFVQGSAEH